MDVKPAHYQRSTVVNLGVSHRVERLQADQCEVLVFPGVMRAEDADIPEDIHDGNPPGARFIYDPQQFNGEITNLAIW